MVAGADDAGTVVGSVAAVMGGLDVRCAPLILSLGLDTFALSTVLGITPLPPRTRVRLALTFASRAAHAARRPRGRRTRVRLALTFASAEGLMPAVGLLLGRPLGDTSGAVY